MITIRSIPTLILIFYALAIVAYFTFRTVKQGKIPHLRKIPALDAIAEGMGRALETGRKAHCGVITSDSLGSQRAADILVSVSLTGYFARIAAKQSVPAIYSCSTGEILTLVNGVVHESYMAEGKSDLLNDPEQVKVELAPPGDNAYPVWVNSMQQRENVGFCMFVGAGSSNLSILLGEAARDINALSIAGMPDVGVVMYAVSFDYFLLMTENFAAGAWLVDDKVQLGNLSGMDILTWSMILLTIAATIVATVLNTNLGKILTG